MIEKVHLLSLIHILYRYVTEGTFDAYLWQTVENKQKFISQIMTSKSPVRSSGYETATDRKDQKNHRITPFSMAQMNCRRSRKKTVITLTSLGLTGVFLVTPCSS